MKYLKLPKLNIKIVFAVLVAAVPMIVGLFEIYSRINTLLISPSLKVKRVSISEHYLNYTSQNLLGGDFRYKHLGERKFKERSAQVSVEIVNPTNRSYGFNTFTLNVTDAKTLKSYWLPTYFIVNKLLNPTLQFNSTVVVPPNSSVDVEFDVIIGKLGEQFMANGAKTFHVGFLDLNKNPYKQKIAFDKPRCEFAYQFLFNPGEPASIHGKSPGFNPYNHSQKVNN